MANLTSLYQNVPHRDISIQACADCLQIMAGQNDYFKEYKFTDVFDISGGTQPPKSKFIHEERNGYVRFLQIRDFSSNSTPTFIPVSKTNKLCTDKDILLGRYGASVGKILTGKQGAYNVACAKIVFKKPDLVYKDYLFYWLHSSYFQNYLTSISRSAQGGFNKNDLSRIKISLPSKANQMSLVNILKSFDESLLLRERIKFNIESPTNIEKAFIDLSIRFLSMITENEDLSSEFTHQLDMVKQLRQAYLREAMQGKLTEDWRASHPELVSGSNSASQLLASIKAEKEKLVKEGKLKKEKSLPQISDDEIPFEIPEGWAWCRMGKLALLSEAGKSFRCVEVPISEDEWGVIKVSAVSWNVFLEEQNKMYSKYEPNDISAKIEVGDFLISRANTSELVGKSVIVKYISKNLLLSDKTIRFRFSDLVSTEFINLCNNSKHARKYYSLKGTGSSPSMKNITRDHMKELLLPIPPLLEQEQIVTKLDELMQYCDQLEESIKTSQRQNEMLLQQVLREALEPKENVMS